MNSTAKAILASICLGLVACETAQDNNIEQAQQCLNNASQLSATDANGAALMATNTCQPMIANIQTIQAGLIGVGLVLVEEQKIANLSQIQSAVSNGNNAVATSLSFLVFSTQTDVTNMTVYATMSEDAGSKELASMISLAYYTNAAAAGGLNSSSTPAQVSGYVTSLASDPVNGPPAAQALLAAQQSACAGSGSSSSLCTDLTKAIGPDTSSYTTILNNAATYINNGG